MWSCAPSSPSRSMYLCETYSVIVSLYHSQTGLCVPRSYRVVRPRHLLDPVLLLVLGVVFFGLHCEVTTQPSTTRADLSYWVFSSSRICQCVLGEWLTRTPLVCLHLLTRYLQPLPVSFVLVLVYNTCVYCCL